MTYFPTRSEEPVLLRQPKTSWARRHTSSNVYLREEEHHGHER